MVMQTQAAILSLVAILAVSCLYWLANVRGRPVNVLSVLNILNVIVLQWWLSLYGLSALASLGVMAASLAVLNRRAVNGRGR